MFGPSADSPGSQANLASFECLWCSGNIKSEPNARSRARFVFFTATWLNYFLSPPPQQRHKHIHTGQRNFVCPICAKRFREAGELQRHQRVHTGEKPYQCQLCHTRFAERNTLRRHTKRKHPYHQVAMEMLSERSGGNRGSAGGGSGVQEEEESAEWYNSTVSNFDNSESEAET